MAFARRPSHHAAVSPRSINVLDAAPLARRNVIVLELDTPNPLTGVAIGMVVTLVFKDGRHLKADLKGLGFASSTPEHAHIIVSAPIGLDVGRIDIDSDLAIDRIEVEPRA